MPDEEMEISTDTDHQDRVEDIDIDLDFAGGINDEDLELGDFDQTEEYEQFNSDTRDELMAEGDDASYGMTDVEITYGESAVAANDFDIDISGTDNNMWEVNNTSIFDESHGPANGTQPEALGDDRVDRLDFGSAGDSTLLQAMPIASVPEQGDSAQKVEETDQNVTKADALSPAIVSLATGIPSDGILAQDVDGTLAAHEGELGVETTASEDVNIDGQQQQDGDEPSKAEELEDNQNASKQSSKSAESVTMPVPEEREDQGYRSSRDESEEEEIDYDPLDDDQSLARPENNSLISPKEQQNDQGSAEEDADGTGTNSSWIDGATEIAVHETQEVNNLFDKDGDHEDAVDGTEVEASTAPNTAEHLGGASSENKVHDEDEGSDLASNPQNTSTELLASIAVQYEILVNYGKTDYRLFAKSESDDPNQYFFKDTSAVELTLDAFLLGLRNVISQEVSPLDELVVHVDGLGLEFSESTTITFLGSYTFGHIMSLYDSLVRNDEPGDAPELYIYLTVRPSCAQRLLALQDQASAGRSLTDIAVYRESTPMDGDDVADEGEELAITPDGELEDDIYDGEEVSEEQDSQHHSENSEHEIDPNSTDTIESTQPTKGTIVTADQHFEETTEHDTDKDANADLLDYDELDFTPSKQDFTDINPETTQSAKNDVIDETHDVSTRNNEQSGDALSQSTSATATLDGEDKDEIDYDEDDNGDGRSAATESKAQPVSADELVAQADDEITWESENEDADNDAVTLASKASEQVSTTPGKRTRSDSDAAGAAGEENDVKRHRS